MLTFSPWLSSISSCLLSADVSAIAVLNQRVRNLILLLPISGWCSCRGRPRLGVCDLILLQHIRRWRSHHGRPRGWFYFSQSIQGWPSRRGCPRSGSAWCDFVVVYSRLAAGVIDQKVRNLFCFAMHSRLKFPPWVSSIRECVIDFAVVYSGLTFSPLFFFDQGVHDLILLQPIRRWRSRGGCRWSESV